jgi:hypothetical protein
MVSLSALHWLRQTRGCCRSFLAFSPRGEAGTCASTRRPVGWDQLPPSATVGKAANAGHPPRKRRERFGRRLSTPSCGSYAQSRALSSPAGILLPGVGLSCMARPRIVRMRCSQPEKCQRTWTRELRRLPRYGIRSVVSARDARKAGCPAVDQGAATAFTAGWDAPRSCGRRSGCGRLFIFTKRG